MADGKVKGELSRCFAPLVSKQCRRGPFVLTFKLAPPDPMKAVDAGLMKDADSLRRCWEKAADEALAGDLVLEVVFGRGGKAKKVRVASDGPGNEVLTECVVSLAKSWKWGATVENQTLRIPLTFPLTFG